jgi:hypothetical protein
MVPWLYKLNDYKGIKKMNKIEKKIQELETKLEEKLMIMPQKSIEELLKESEMLFPKKGKI